MKQEGHHVLQDSEEIPLESNLAFSEKLSISCLVIGRRLQDTSGGTLAATCNEGQ